jgi:hypothetical protein
MLLGLPLALACQGDHLTPPPLVDEQVLYWALDLSHHAVTLSTTAPYDTLTLVATPRNQKGEPLTGLPAPRYTTTDAERVLVTPQGVLAAVAPTSAPIQVTATLTTGNLTHTDTVLVKVVDDPTPPRLATFSIHPVPPDSAKSAAGGSVWFAGTLLGVCKTLLVQAVDSNGMPMADLLTAFRSSDPNTADFDLCRDVYPPAPVTGSRVFSHRPGTVTLYASTTAFGITKADTLPFRVGYPIKAVISVPTSAPALGGNPVDIFVPSEVKVGVGALIQFGGAGIYVGPADSTDIIFTGTDLPNIAAVDTSGFINQPWGVSFITLADNCNYYPPPWWDCTGAGNIFLPLQDLQDPRDRNGGSTAFRVFTVPGTYEYHSTIHGTGGRIIVVDER